MHRLTYLSQHLKNGKLFRWPKQCFPLTINITPCCWYSMSEVERYNYKGMVLDAFREWERVSNGVISYVFVDNINDSQINVAWRRVDRKSLGNCEYSIDSESRLYSADVSIGISDGIIHRKYMDENEVYHTILHEIGHAFGLGHSTNPEDIMYTPHQYGVVKLSKRDINSIRWLYSLPYGASVESLNNTYSLSCTNIDDIIMKISNKEATSQFQKTLNSIKTETRNLQEEQDKLALMKKFQISMQNVRLPKEIADKFKDM